MHSYSQHHVEDLNEDVFDEDIKNDINDSYANMKTRRAVDNPSNYPIIHRALSTVSANQTLVHNQRNVLAKTFRRISFNDEIVTIDHNDADASFLLPNLYELNDDIRTRVMDSLVDTPTMVTLEETKRLNWWVNKDLSFPRLYPLLTSGDGNCLLHATSLAMWGFHDHSLTMRRALNETMITLKPNNSLYRRWRWAQSVQNKKYGLVFSEQEWNEEWKSLLKLSSAEPRVSQKNSNNNLSDANSSNDDANRSKSSQTIIVNNIGGCTKSTSQSTRQYYESLEEFHVYVLANNIRRPIIVYSDTILRTNDGEAISPIEFGGIYLPLEIPPEKCHKQPVFLAFDAAHFSALVPMEQNNKTATTSMKVIYQIPLIDIEAVDLLPIHYFIDPGIDFIWPIDQELSDEKIHLYTQFGEGRMEILEKYLNLSKESCRLNILLPTGTVNSNCEDDFPLPLENNSTSVTNMDLSLSTNESNLTMTSVSNKKLPRSSLNSFSKIIRRTFIQPFSSMKRSSIKQQKQDGSSDASDMSSALNNENKRRTSSPLVNRRTNTLTIIVTNFQPKRPKTCDNMIKNYIDACMNEYRTEKSQKQNEQTPTKENEYHLINKNISNLNYRYQTMTNKNPYQQNSSSTLISSEKSTRKLPIIPVQSVNKMNSSTKFTQKNSTIDDPEDTLPMENGQFSSNINYVQQTKRKSNQLTQSNSLEISHNRQRYPESIANGPSTNRPIKSHSSNSNVLPTTFQPGFQHQQSLAQDKQINSRRLPELNTNNRGSVKSNTGNNILLKR